MGFLHDHPLGITGIPHEVVETASRNPETIVQPNLRCAEVFVSIPDDMYTKLRKRHTSANDIVSINEHFADHHEQHIGADEKRVTTENITIDVPKDKEDHVRDILKKNKWDWSWKLGEINVTEIHNDLISDAKQFKYPLFHAGTKTRALDCPRSDKQL